MQKTTQPIEELVKLRDQGERLNQIAARFGVSPQAISQRLQRAGYQKSRTPAQERMTRERRYWRRVEMAEGCWEWRGCIDTSNYGRVRWGKRHEYAHRIAWMLAN